MKKIGITSVSLCLLVSGIVGTAAALRTASTAPVKTVSVGKMPEPELPPVIQPNVSLPEVQPSSMLPEPEPVVPPVETPESEQTQEPPKQPLVICENDGVDEAWISQVNQSLSVVPEQLLSTFQASGWHMYCTSMDIDATYYNSQFGAVMGTTNYDEARILIEDRIDAVHEAPVHELGHWFDYQHGFLSDTAEYQSIYSQEADAFRDYYGVTFYFDTKELLAEGFWKAFTDPEGLQACAPQLYQYIQANSS